MSFKIGDRVELKGFGSGVVAEVNEGPFSYSIELNKPAGDGATRIWARECDLVPSAGALALPEPRESTHIPSTGEAIVAQRGEDYGHPTRNFYRIAALWSAIIGTEVTPHDVALMMIAMKISREKSSHKDDNLLDMEGYVHCLRLLTSEGTTSAEEVGTKHEVAHEV